MSDIKKDSSVEEYLLTLQKGHTITSDEAKMVFHVSMKHPEFLLTIRKLNAVDQFWGLMEHIKGCSGCKFKI